MGARLTIDPSKTRGRIHPFVYGQFLEQLGSYVYNGFFDPGNPRSDASGFRLDVLEKVRELAPPILRWPGGAFAKIYHWRDAVGPLEGRIRRRNLMWGGVEDGRFGTAEFVDLCRRLGAEPFLCVNMSTGNAEEAADWVEYCNGTTDTVNANLRRSHGYDEPFGVRTWGIGNEQYAREDIGSLYDAGRYVVTAWEYVKHMKMQDPALELAMVGRCGDDAWNEHVLRELHPVCDYLSLHFYATSRGGAYGGVFRDLERLERDIRSAERQIATLPETVTDFSHWYRFPARKRPVQIALDEWNVWETGHTSAEDPYGLLNPYCWRDALWVASALNLFHRHASTVTLANMAQMVNLIAPIRADRNGVVVETIHWPMVYYRRHCGDRAVAFELQTPRFTADGATDEMPALDASVSRVGADGPLVAVVVNRDPEADVELTIRTEEGATPGIRNAISLTAPSWSARNRMGEPDCVVIRELDPGRAGSFPVPRHSIALLTMER